ncbi:branched-chain amino acid ABC transporter permease [Ruminococcaceae bacterium OttesenSCG-928-A11]|nr:branched-chain amino acid ABC transporter permease [Ruminococcaceae bacterium OttesenSCG-928-A11]
MKYLTSICILAGINVITVSGLTLLTGYMGMFSMGHAGFMAIGGYISACMTIYLGVPFVPALLIGALAAALSSLIVGYPTLKNKLTGDYFAIAMLGFGESIRLIIANTKPFIGGALGLTGIPKKTTIWVVVIFAVIIIYCMRNYLKSHYGKNATAIRQQEVAAEMMGINIMSNKIWALVISAFTAGFAGGLYAFFATTLYPITFTSVKSTDILAAVVFGGINSLSGPLIAAFILAFLPELLRSFAQWRLVIYGLLFVVIMIFRPEGLMGYKEVSPKGMVRFVSKTWNRLFKKEKSKGEQ